MTYRTAALDLATAAGIPIGREVRSVLEDPTSPRHAAALADDIVEEAAKMLPPGDYRHPRYGCTCRRHGAGVGFLATDPGGQEVQIECRWLQGHRTCKHIAETIAEQPELLLPASPPSPPSSTAPGRSSRRPAVRLATDDDLARLARVTGVDPALETGQ